jgi:hypothetical protein
MKKLLILAVAVLCVPCVYATQATVPSCPSFVTGGLGGIAVTCVNPNSTASNASVMIYTEDGTTPTSNGLGTAAVNGIVLAPVIAGQSQYNGYFTINVPGLTLKIIAGVNGQTDSTVATYAPTVPTQNILATNFGWQCGFGVSTNCPIVSGVLTWPTSIAVPKVLRTHDSGSEVSVLTPVTDGVYNWTKFDPYLDAIAAHPGTVGVQQFTSIPCRWAAGGAICGQISNYGNGTNAPPSDLGTGPMGSSPKYNTFISTFLAHTSTNGHSVASNISVFQLWNEWNLTVHWNGTAAQLYAMIAYPAQLIRAAIPGAVILGPSNSPYTSGGANGQSGNPVTDLTTWLNLENTNGVLSDGIDWHEYLTATSTTTNTPEVQWVAVAAPYITAQNAVAGWKNSPWFDTETNFNAGTNYLCPAAQYSAADCIGQIIRQQIFHDSNGAAGFYWYYGNNTIGQSYIASTAYLSSEKYLIGGHFTGAAFNSSGTIWLAPFVGQDGVTRQFVWTSSEAAGQTYTVPSGYYSYRDINGGRTITSATTSVPISTQPVMLEQATAPIAVAPAF